MFLQAFSPNYEKFQLERLREGDKKAFEFFYDQYSLSVYRKLFKMIKMEVIAEEILQTAFIKVWEKRELINPEKGLRAYLYQIVQNVVYDFYRTLAREEKMQQEMKYAIEIYSDNNEESLNFKETKELLEMAIEQLPEQQKLIFRLCKQEGKSYAEV